MSITIEHTKGDQLHTTDDRFFVVTEVHVTQDGKTISYELQEEDDQGNPVGESLWYSSDQIAHKGNS